MKKALLLISILTLFSPALIIAQEFATGNIGIVVNDYGRMRMYTPDPNGTRQIERVSVLVGTSASAVFDYLEDADTEIGPFNPTTPQYSDFEIYGAFNNNYSAAPPEVMVGENFYGWTDGAYCVIKYTVHNQEAAQITAVIGMEFIPYLNYTYGNDTVKYIADEEIVSIFRNRDYVGLKFLSASMTSLSIFNWFEGYNEDDGDLWDWLNYGVIDTLWMANEEGSVLIPALSPMTIEAGDSCTFYFAAAYAGNETNLLTQIGLAEDAYNNNFTEVEHFAGNAPANFRLLHNYPNPFNPATTIDFTVMQKQHIELKIYNQQGQEIAVLADEEFNPGNYSFDFNGGSIAGGIYFCTLSCENFTQTQKMVLLK